MRRLRMRVDPRQGDPHGWGHSFVNLAELAVPCLDAVGARSVLEVGAYAGELTALLLEWAARADARVIAVDPMPQDELEWLARQRPDLELVREPSLDALRHLELPDAIVIDGDHNHFTVTEELRIVIERSAGAPLPLLLFHDVGWPHGRRDAYYSPELIPEDRRRPITEGGGLVPWDPGTTEEGLRYKYPASREGGPGNGVLTAVEDIVAGHPQLRLAVVQAFFGFGAVWDTRAPWADAVAELLDPWDRDPVFERLEADRVLHLATQVVHKVRTDRVLARIAQQDELLSRLLGSRTLALAERIGRLGRGGRAGVSREDVRRVLEP